MESRNSAPVDEAELEDRLSAPDDVTCDALASLDGDVLVMGAGGKMGPTLARMARRALDLRGIPRTGASARRVIAVSRFSNESVAARLQQHGVEIIRADLADPDAYKILPSVSGHIRNVVWMVGQKFGTTGDPVATWTHNVAAAAFGAEQCRDARVVCFSSGNVYPRTPVDSGGSREDSVLLPDGEYAASVIGRERVFESAARRLQFPLLLYRLFYACDLRYGVVTDIALQILRDEVISLATPAANVIWQGDANRLALRALTRATVPTATVPAATLNVTGPVVRVRDMAMMLGVVLHRDVHFDETDTSGTQPNVLLANTDALQHSLPFVAMPIETLCEWTAHWVQAGGRVLSKPTRFDVRDGRY